MEKKRRHKAVVFMFLCFFKVQDRLEAIAVDVKRKGSALKLCETFGDRKSKSASFGVSGGIAADKTLGQLIGADIQRL